MQLSDAGRHREALEVCGKARSMARRAPPVYFVTGLVQQSAGAIDKAIAAYRKAVKLEPGYFDAWINLGVCHRALGEFANAAKCYERAIVIAPSVPLGYKNLGMVHVDQDDHESAAAAFAKALEVEPDSASSEHALAYSLRCIGRSDEAIAHYRRAIDIEPDRATAYLDLANYLQMLDRFDEAEQWAEKLLERDPENSEALFALSSFRTPKIRTPEALLGHVEALVDKKGASAEDRARYAFAAARLHERAGDDDRTFHFYKVANDIRKEGYSINWDAYSNWFAELKQVYTADLIAEKSALGHASNRPIFVIGMPRTGTTLVEQIIAAHHSAFGVGEFQYLEKMVQGLSGSGDGGAGYPACVAGFDGKTLTGLAEGYLAAIDIAATRLDAAAMAGTGHSVDKYPGNLFRVGLISILFPNASIVHCRRDPLDTCLSNYFQPFERQHLAYSFDLEDLGRYYRLYHDLMEHWRRVLPKPFFELDYDQLVREPEPVVRGMIEHCGLAWDDACLEFHSQGRQVETASLWQVRQPIYSGSSGKWRRYEKHLGPLKEALADLVPAAE